MVTGAQLTELLNEWDESSQLPDEWLETEGIDRDSCQGALDAYCAKHTPVIYEVHPYTLIMIGLRLGLWIGRKERNILEAVE